MSAEEVRRSIAETAPSLFECSPAPQGGVRVRTPLVVFRRGCRRCVRAGA